MDTPDKNQIRTPISKFEDSPVYNYINSLSPIKSVKSLTISNTLNSLSFASPPSVFSSPQVSAQKDSKFLRRYHFSGYSRPDLSSENRIRSSSGLGVTDAAQVSECSADQLETFDPKSCIREDTVDATNGNLELPIELPRTLSYDCGSPEGNQAPSHCIKTNSMSVMSDTQAVLSQSFKEDTLERSLSFQNKMELPGTCQFEQNKEEEAGCDWENLISDAADLLLFDTSKNEEASCVQDQNLVDPGSCSFTSLLLPKDASDGEIHNTQTIVQVDSCREHEAENPPAKSVEVENPKEINQTPLLVSSTFQNKQHANLPNEEIDEKAESHIHFGQKQRGIRRRCLVFDSAGAQKKKLEDDSNSSSSVSSQSGEKFASEDKQLVPFRRCTSSSPCILPSIGLHLNALSATTKDPRVVKHETLASGKELISMLSSMTSFSSLSSEQNPSSKALVLNSLKTDMDPASNEVQVMQNVSRASAFDVNEDFSESPKKKRRRMEHAGESESSCKRCNCKKSKCLKLYCECFAAGVYCVEPCSCLECFNKPIHEDTVLATRKQIESRNPLAFAPKVIRSSEPVTEIGEVSNKTPASARHKRGCNCKKSGCLKKYCECYQGGVGCSINCRCGSCKNPFGVKDGGCSYGFTSMGIEEAGQEETEAHEKDGLNRNFQRNEVCKEEVQHSDNTLPLTFSFQICRTSVQLPFSSFGKPPRSPILPQRKSEKHFQISPDDETPEILRGNSSPISGVKTASPNSKRVSPPHGQLSSSPGMRSSRKLVLQSIPSFPSLTQLQNGDFK